MVATTYGGAGIAVSAETTGAKAKGFWSRAFTAVADSQMKRAERELAHYAYLLPRDFELTRLRNEDEPFGGW
jgi:hypothetical protein